MKLVALLIITLAAAFATPLRASFAAPDRHDFHIVGYLPDYRVEGFDASRIRYVTDLIYFSIQPTDDGGIDSTLAPPAVLAKLKAWKKKYHVRVEIAMGGDQRSGAFPTVTVDPIARENLVNAVTKFLVQNGFDGIDYDWEGPSSDAEQAGYSQLLVDTKAAFRPHGLRLTVAVAPGQSLSNEAVNAIDGIGVMAYDHDGRHSTFEQAQGDINGFLARNVPAHKLILGLPFYARPIDKSEPEATYSEVVTAHHPKPDVDEVAGVYFNGPKTIRRKTDWAREKGLGGVMIWELGQDTNAETSLLNAMSR